MPVLQSINYLKLTKVQLESLRKEKVKQKLSVIFPNIAIPINVEYDYLERVEKMMSSFQTLAERTNSVFQTEFDEQHLVYTVSVISSRFTLESYDLSIAFHDVFSKDTLEIFPTTDEQGHTCISISKRFSF